MLEAGRLGPKKKVMTMMGKRRKEKEDKEKECKVRDDNQVLLKLVHLDHNQPDMFYCTNYLMVKIS
ncbi:conserved hypothetical protein [Ricinus communis]|uniref:Uncharacterized protein n=1 Tax=Ricinus communis TaxID=3988 RepID=B9T3H6_RICCO|nr:conserved hypothetical protein [Ricinus communis]